MKLRNKKTGEIVEAKSFNSGTGSICIYYEEYDGGIGTRECFETLAELNEEWEDAEQNETKRYRLLKDLPTFKAGDEFFADEYGSLWLDQSIDGEPNSSRVMAYHGSTIDKFPNILEEWFEEIKPDEPLIKDEKVRRAVNIWLSVQEQPIVEVAITCNKDSDGFFNYTLYGYIEDARMSNGKAVRNNNLTAINFEFRSSEKIEFDINHDYTIKELCGEQE